MTEHITDVVALAPGFLGFDHFGGFPYFGQSVATAIRVALEGSRVIASGALSINTCETNPAGSLAERQRTFYLAASGHRRQDPAGERGFSDRPSHSCRGTQHGGPRR